MLNRPGLFFFPLTLLFTLSAIQSPIRAEEGWLPSYEEAQTKSEQTGAPLLLHFYAPWCGPCKQMESQVFSDPVIRKQLAMGIAAVEVDVSKNPELASRFEVATVPRDIIVYPGKKPETVGVGFQSRATYLALLRTAAAKGAASRPATTAPAAAASTETLIGLEGFCPVRLIRDREWVTGNQKISESYRGITYYFSSEKEREIFREDARRYTPRNLGCDPVVLREDQKAVTGKIKYGAFFDNQLYLFKSFEHRREFKQNPLKYTRIQHAVRADQLAGQKYQ